MSPLRSSSVRTPARPGRVTAILAIPVGALALGALAGTALAETPPRGSGGFSALTTPEPPPRPVPIEAFYEVLRDHGTFIDSDRYGVLFCPHPEEVGADFQPYLRGHWIMTESGWTFTSDLKISWVTDHYGRWVEAGLQNCNWAWLPGGQWGPAWVDFRVGEKVIAWRPQPYTGPRVTLQRPEAAHFPRFNLPAANYSSDSGYVAVRDGEFLSRRLDYVALTGVQLYSALRETEPLVNLRAGLNSDERDRIVARIMDRKAAQVAAASSTTSGGKGGAAGAAQPDAFEPAQRRRKPGATGAGAAGSAGVVGAAGSVRTGLLGAADAAKEKEKAKTSLTGTKPGESPPDRTNMATGSSAGSPGQFSGTKVLEWGKPKPPPKLGLPPPPPPDPSAHKLAPEPGPKK